MRMSKYSTPPFIAEKLLRTLVIEGCFCLLPKMAEGVVVNFLAGREGRAEGNSTICLPWTNELDSCGMVMCILTEASARLRNAGESVGSRAHLSAVVK